MFYNHEILTSRKHGVATVWLVATLGNKSSTKKITRKAILDVDVKKACNTILEPDAPMALRLQSNLLYGVSRVYGQQVGYVLSDTIHVEQGLRGLLGKKLIGSLDLDNNIKVKPAQLMLMDDPAFDLDMPLPGLDLDYDFNINADQSQNRDSQISLSIHSQRGRSGSISSSQGASIMGLNISSSLSAGGYQLPLDDPFVKSSAQKSGIHGDRFDDEAIMFEDNDVFEFDQDGEIRDLTAQDIASRRAANTSGAPRLGSDTDASARVRKEHDDARAQAGDHGRIYDEDGDMNMIFGDDGGIILPDAEPFGAFMSGALPAPVLGRKESISQSEDSSSESAAAPSRLRKPKTKKQLPIDQTLRLKNSDLSVWHREYVKTQDGLSAAKLVTKGNTLAKKNALMFVIGNGLNGAGIGIGSTKLSGPLSMFSGDALFAKITGRVLGSAKRQADFEGDDNGPNKRFRHSSDEEVPRDFRGDDDFVVQVDEEPFGTPVEVEMGRDAADALADYPSSAMMPWNVSASQRARSSSLRPAGSLKLGSRGVSASPLVGRGSILPGGGDLEKFSSQHDVIMYGRSDDISTDLGGGSGDGMDMGDLAGNDQEFEMFGPAANVDTQTAGTSQWVRDVMDTESENFLDFVRISIEERYDEDEDVFQENGQLMDKKVGFHELFNPETNSEVVAAQAFLHILALATKGRIWVDQDEGESIDAGGNGLGGDIWLGCL